MAAVPTWMMSASFCSPAVLVNSPAPVGAVGADHPLGSLQLRGVPSEGSSPCLPSGSPAGQWDKRSSAAR